VKHKAKTMPTTTKIQLYNMSCFGKEAKWPHHQLAGMKATLDEHPVRPQSHSLHFSEVEQARNKGPQP
jgi:hypothetical protein